jgi:hypothetical protein
MRQQANHLAEGLHFVHHLRIAGLQTRFDVSRLLGRERP